MLWRPKNIDELESWKSKFLLLARLCARKISRRNPPSTTWAGRHSEKAKELILKLNKLHHRFATEVVKAEYQPLINDMNRDSLTIDYVTFMAEQIQQERKDRKSKRGRKHLYLNLQMELLSLVIHLRSKPPLMPQETALDFLRKLLCGYNSDLAMTLADEKVFDIWWNGLTSDTIFESLKRFELDLRRTIVDRMITSESNRIYRLKCKQSSNDPLDRRLYITHSQFMKAVLTATHGHRKSLFEGLVECAEKRPLRAIPDRSLRKTELRNSCIAKKVHFCGQECHFYKLIYKTVNVDAIMNHAIKIAGPV